MNISTEQILVVISVAVSVTTAIFYSAFYLGQIWHRLARIEQDVSEHDRQLAEFRGAGV